MSYIKQMEKDKFVESISGLVCVRMKFVAAGATGTINQSSRADREKAKFDSDGRTIKAIITS